MTIQRKKTIYNWKILVTMDSELGSIWNKHKPSVKLKMTRKIRTKTKQKLIMTL